MLCQLGLYGVGRGLRLGELGYRLGGHVVFFFIFLVPIFCLKNVVLQFV